MEDLKSGNMYSVVASEVMRPIEMPFDVFLTRTLFPFLIEKTSQQCNSTTEIEIT